MTELPTSRAFLPPVALRSLVIAGALALALSGCTASTPASSTGADSGDDIASDSASTETTVDSDSDSDGEVQVIGEDLPSYTALLLATTYAEGRDPQPIVEFLDATSVKFTFPEELESSYAIGSCQIAWGSLQGEGIHVYITAGSVESDCTAEMEG